MDKFYIQMDSFSRQLIHDYEGVMKKIAGLGYAGVEIFTLHGVIPVRTERLSGFYRNGGYCFPC